MIQFDEYIFQMDWNHQLELKMKQKKLFFWSVHTSSSTLKIWVALDVEKVYI